jgi:thiosulfate dehydrogenase (quinone) large subunit
MMQFEQVIEVGSSRHRT